MRHVFVAAPAVKAYLHSSSGGNFDEKTIFIIEVNGSYYRNVPSTVHVGGRPASCRSSSPRSAMPSTKSTL